MKKQTKKLCIVLFACILVITIFKLSVLDNPNMLCAVAEGLDEPSFMYYLVLNRLYKISEKKDVAQEFIYFLENNKNKHLQNIYIRVIGVIGKEDSVFTLKKIYDKYQHNSNFKSTIYYTICSLGLLGDSEAKTFLETILQKYSSLEVQADESLIAISLYIITGDDKYSYLGSVSKVRQIIIPKDLKEVRKIVAASKGRRRTYDEMITLDKLYYRK